MKKLLSVIKKTCKGNFLLLVFSVILLALVVINFLPIAIKESNAAGNTCIWIGTNSESFSDAGNWTDCSGTTPDATDIVKFSSSATRNLSLAENITVAEIRSLTADGFTRTFDSNSFSVTVNGPLTWQSGTLTADASLYTISGNLEISGGTFNYSTSNFTLTGAASNLTTKSDGTTSFYNLTIDKADPATAVSIVDYNFNVRHYLNQKTGILNGAGRTITMSVDNSRYQIGANSGGGTASVKFTMTGYVDGSGGVANNLIELNGAGKTLYWNGSANIKFLTLTDGTMTIQSGKLTIPNDSANGKISCAAGKTLNLTGASAGQMVILRSDLAASQWDLDKNATCTVNVAYADLKDANNTDSASGDISTTNSINSGNNTGFAFASELAVNKWISDVESNWNNAANWSLGHVPTSGESVYFGQGHDGKCNLDITTTVANIISSDYAGEFDGGSSDLRVSSYWTWASGTFTSTTKIFSVSNIERYGGVFIHNMGTLIIKPSSYWSKVNVMTSETFYNLTFDAPYSGVSGSDIASGDTLIVEGTLTLTEGLTNGGTIRLDGDLISTNTFDRGTTTILIDDADKIVNISNGWSLPYIHLCRGTLNAPPEATAILEGIKITDGIFHHNNGTIIFKPGSYYNTIDVASSETFYNLTFDASYSGVSGSDIASGDTLIVDGTLTLTEGLVRSGTIDLNGTLVSTSTFDGGTTTILVDGADQTIDLQDGWKLPAFNLAAGTLNAPEIGTVTFLNNFTNSGGTFNGNGATIWVKGSGDFSAGTFNAGTSTLGFGPSHPGGTFTPGAQIYNNMISQMVDSSRSLTISGTAEIHGNLEHQVGQMNGGQINLKSNFSVTSGFGGTTLVNLNSDTNEQIITRSGGRTVQIRIDKNGGSVTVSDNLSLRSWIYIKGEVKGLDTHSITFSDGGCGTFTPGDFNYSRIIFNKFDCSGTFTLTDPATVENLDITNCASTGSTYNVSKDVTIATTADGFASAIELNGTENQVYTLSSGTAPSSTLTVNKASGNATITGTGTIRGDISVTRGTLDFAAGSTYTIAAGKTITVASGQKLKFAGTSPTNMVKVTSTGTWNLANAADSTITAKYTDVAYSNASNTVNAVYSTNSGNNTNWNFDTSTTRTWISDTAKNWNDPTAWDTGVPSATDFAVFNSAHVGNCTLTANTTVGGIDNSGGYTGILNTTTSNRSLTVNGDFIWNSGTITANNSIISLGANVDLTGGTYTAGGSTFKLTATSDLMTVTAGANTFRHFTIDGVGGGWTMTDNLTLNSGNLTMINGNFDAGAGVLDINGGSLTQNGGYFETADGGTSIIRGNLTRTAGILNNDGRVITFGPNGYTGYTTRTISTNNVLNGTVVNNVGGGTPWKDGFTVAAGTTINFGANPTPDSGLITNNGTIIVDSGTWTSSFLTNNGTIIHNGDGWVLYGTFINNPTGNITYAGAEVLCNPANFTQNGTFDLTGKTVRFGGGYTGYYTYTVTANGELGGKLVLDLGPGNSLTVASGTIVDLGDNPISKINPIYGAGRFTNNGTINVGSGTWTLNGVDLVNMGTINHNGDGWDVNGSFTNSGTVKYSGVSVSTAYNFTQNGTLDDSLGAWSGKTITMDSSANATLSGTGTIPGNLTIAKSAVSNTVTVGSDLNIGGDLTLTQGTLSPGTYTLSVGGNANLSGGAFTAGTSTIRMMNTTADPKTFNGGTKTFNNIQIAPGSGTLTFSGAFSFADMTMSAEGTKPIKFTPGTTLTMTGDQFLTGNGANLVTVTSTSDGSHWTLNKSSGLVLTDYLSLKDSHATGGAEFYALTNSNLVSNTTGWVLEDGAPDNPTTFKGYETSAKTVEISSGDWNNDPNIHFEWSGADDRAGSGVDGYYIYFGTDSGSDPEIASGIIEDDTSPHYTTNSYYTLNKAMTSNQTYYFILKTKDNAGYISDSNNYFTYKFDNINPSPPEYVSVDPAGCTTQQLFTFTWPVAEDEVGGSGINKYQYKKGSTGTIHDNADTELEETPYQNLDNVLYVRSVDNAGNTSDFRTKVYCVTGFVTIESDPEATIGPNSLSISWRSSRDTSSYVQVYDSDNTFITEQGTDDQTDDHEVKIIGLKPENSYRYRLSWSDPDGNIGSSGWYEAQTATTPQIKNFEIDVLSTSSAIITFSTNYLATARVEYGKESFSNVVPLPGQANSFTQRIDDLEPGTNYILQIRAETTDGAEFTAGRSFTTLETPQISNISLYSLGVNNGSSLRVTWTTNVETTSSLYYRPIGGSYTEITYSQMTKNHEVIIPKLLDDSSYQFYLQGIDQFGNIAKSDIQTFSTPLDTRPPEISDIVIETSNVGTGKEDKAQAAISYSTDEPAKCIIEYAEGISGDNYSNKTPSDEAMSNSHLTIITDLTPQTPYHFRIICSDKGNNSTTSSSQTIISGEVTQSVFTLILKTLNSLFGWMKVVL